MEEQTNNDKEVKPEPVEEIRKCFSNKIKILKRKSTAWNVFKNPITLLSSATATYNFRTLNHLAMNHLSIIPPGKLIHLLK